jgi:hypothetical protein
MVRREKRCRATPYYHRTRLTRSSSYDYEIFIIKPKPPNTILPLNAPWLPRPWVIRWCVRSDVEGIVEEELGEVAEVDESVLLVGELADDGSQQLSFGGDL